MSYQGLRNGEGHARKRLTFSVSQIKTTTLLKGGSAHAIAQTLLKLHAREVWNDCENPPGSGR